MSGKDDANWRRSAARDRLGTAILQDPIAADPGFCCAAATEVNDNSASYFQVFYPEPQLI